MTEQQAFTDYYQQVQQLTSDEGSPSSHRDELLGLIQSRLQEALDSSAPSDTVEYYQGELDFFQGQLKSALEHYLKAKKVSLCRFSFYRTTAALLKEQGNLSKAIGYARKALSLQPDDGITLNLMREMHPELGGFTEDADEEDVEIESPAVSLGASELDDLSNIFKAASSYPTTDEPSFMAAETAHTKEHPQTLPKTLMEPAMETHQNTYPSASEKTQTKSASGGPSPSSAVSELTELARSSNFTVEKSSTDKFLSSMGLGGVNPDDLLQGRIDSFQRHYRELIAKYIKEGRSPSHRAQDGLYVLNGWDYSSPSTASANETGPELQSETGRSSSGGFFLSWSGTGIAINPGLNFLKNLHQVGLTVLDIDCVVVTRNTHDAYSDIQAIYDLNYQVNLNSPDSNLHIISYYLNQESYRDLSSKLKANFKQERNTLYSLELYVDSPDVEKVKLSDTVTLNYFLTASQENGATNPYSSGSNLGLRLDFSDSGKEVVTTVGYVSGSAWSPMLSHNLGRCDTLLCGFGETNSKDFRKVKYNESSLGYFGTFSLMEEVAPRVIIACEFMGREGDIRLEAVKKMRQEYAYSNSQGTAILPGDTGLFLDLRTMNVRCSVSAGSVDPSQVHVIKTSSAFGPLQYLSPNSVA